MVKDKTLKIKNLHLDLLVLLLDKPRHGQDARAKNRFLKMVQPRRDEKEKTRKEILENHADKDKGGKSLMEEYPTPTPKDPTKKGKRLKLTEKNLEKAQAEYAEYCEEELIIDVLPSNKVDIGAIKMMLEADTTDLPTIDGAVYDILCEAFEKALE